MGAYTLICPELSSHPISMNSKVLWLAAELLVGSRLEGNWIELRSFSMAKKLIVAANSLALFGKELSRGPKFLKAALNYPEDLLRTAEILRLIPLALGPFAAPLLMRQYRASKVLVEYLLPVVEDRLNESRSQPDLPHPQHVDCIQFFVNANLRKDNWSARKIVQVILGIWFASVHQPAISLVYAMRSLQLSQICLNSQNRTCNRRRQWRRH